MSNDIKISASIVLYKENIEIVKNTILCFLKIDFKKKLYLIDNSPTNYLEKYLIFPDSEYKFIGKKIDNSTKKNIIINEK